MSELFITMPFGLFVAVFVAVMGVAAYEIIKINKEESDAPKKYIMYSLLLLSPILISRRYALENPFNNIFDSILNLLFVLGSVAFVVSLLYAWKKTAKSKATDSQQDTLKVIGLIMVALIIFIMVVYFFF